MNLNFPVQFGGAKFESSVGPRRNCKRSVHSEFPSALNRRNLKTQQSPVILVLCLNKTRAGKSHDYLDVIVYETLRFQNVFRPS